MYTFRSICFYSILSVMLFASCGGSKKAASTTASSTELSDIDGKVSMLAADASFSEKSAALKAPEKGTVKMFYDADGALQKVEKETTSPWGSKVSKYFFSDNNLIYTNHFEKNTSKVKGKVLFTDTKYYFGANKILGAVQKTLKLKPSDEGALDMKLTKEKFKSITPNPNMLRDEMLVIKKLKTLVK
jgi:hypothetical protein